MPDPESVKIQLDGLVQVAKWISYFILLGAGLSVTVSVMSVTGSERFKLGQLEFPLSWFVYIAMALTGVHAFFSWVFVQRASAIAALGKSNAALAWERLTNSEALIFFNMRPRILGTAPWPLGQAYVAQGTDTAFWLTLVLAIALIAAVTLTLAWFEAPEGSLQRVTVWSERVAVACALASANWIIGTQWAIAASRLASSG